MPQPRLPASAEGLPITRDQVERHVEALIDLLDHLDADPEAEPDLGWPGGAWTPADQSDVDFTANANAGDDREADGDDLEPDVDDEPSLGWTTHSNQETAGRARASVWGIDLEAGVGPVKKKRSPSKTGGAVFRGCGVLSRAKPPRPGECGKFSLSNRRAAR